MLKGKNQKIFRERVVNLIKLNTKDLNVKLIQRHDRLYLEINGTDPKCIEERLLRVSGIGSFSFILTSSKDFESIISNAVTLIKNEVKTTHTFKIETKRSDKTIPYTSQEISQLLSKSILPQLDSLLEVDVKNPDLTLHVEIRDEVAFLYLTSIKGLGGFPVGVAGKGSLLISGGIDSPVAGFLAMKQGIEVEGIHFESTPMTSIESAQKVVELAKKLAIYTPRHELKVSFVPFFKLHQAIIDKISPAYVITVMRRMFFRVATKLTERNHGLVLITGESVGQVASQTLDSMATIESVTTIPVIRPLITTDKQDIIKIAKKIDTYDLSIEPFEDCCTIYTPTGSTTKPSIKKALINERFMVDFEALIHEIVLETITMVIKPDSDIHLPNYGFTVKEAWEAMQHDHIQR